MTRDPWQRRDTETHRAFAAFVAYRDLGDARTLNATLTALGKVAGNRRYLETWSSQHDWPARAAAFDAHLDAIKIKTIEKEVAQDAKDCAFLSRLLLRKSIDGLLHGNLSGKDAIRAADTAVKLLRLLNGESTERTEVSTTQTIEEFRELAAEAEAELDEYEARRTTEGESDG